jgi:hypothetical protein
MELTLSLTLISYLALAVALVVQYGEYTPKAFFASFVGLIGLGLAVFFSRGGEKPSRNSRLSLAVSLNYSFLISLVLMAIGPPLLFWVSPEIHRQFLPFLLGMFVLALLLFFFRERPKILAILLALALILWAFFSYWAIHLKPDPAIDVWYFHQAAAESLLRGENPYHKIFFIPIQTTAYQVTDRYVYPPFTLLLSTFFFRIFGDVRFANLFSQGAAVLFLWGSPGIGEKQL